MTSSRKSSPRKRSIKKFTFKQIKEKVADRWEIPEYYDILMEAVVNEVEDGYEFNLKHPSFQKLVKLVKDFDSKHPKKPKIPQNPSTIAVKRKSKNIRVKSKLRKNKKTKSQQEWLDILSEQLSSFSPNCKIVREACKHVGIPVNLRGTIWKILLDVPNKKAELFETNNQSFNQDFVSIHSPKSSSFAMFTKDNTDDIPLEMNAEFEPLRDDPPPLYNQRVIQADIERTRPTMECFKNASVRREMEIILTEYCHRKKVSYKQGMNYVLAPFFMIEMKDRLDIYLCFSSFIEKYLNSTFNDEDFGSLQCIFRMFRLLIQYHDPQLSVFLDFHEIMPELFASGWFMTIHANKCSKNTLLHLWDEMLLQSHPCFHYFIDLELLRFNRDEILIKSGDELPQFLVNFIIDDRDHARRLIKSAIKTSQLTPLSYHEMLKKCCSHKIIVDSTDYIRLEKLPCVNISERELIGHCYSEELLLSQTKQNGHKNVPSKPPPPTPITFDNNNNSMERRYTRKVKKILKQSAKYAEQKQYNTKLKFFILDCRSSDQYESGHLPCAFHLDPKLELSSEKLRSKLMSLLSMKGCHFVLFFDGRHNSSDQLLLNQNDPLSLLTNEADNKQKNSSYHSSSADEQQLLRQSYLYFFLDKRVKFISICESGYAGCHELIVGNLELIDHNSDKCIECNGKWKHSLLSSVKGRFNYLLKNSLQAANGSVEKLRNRMLENSRMINNNNMFIEMSGDMSGELVENGNSISLSKLSKFTKQNSNYDGNRCCFMLHNNQCGGCDWKKYADQIFLCKNEPMLMMYLAIIRNRETSNEQFQDCVQKLLLLILYVLYTYV